MNATATPRSVFAIVTIGMMALANIFFPRSSYAADLPETGAIRTSIHPLVRGADVGPLETIQKVEKRKGKTLAEWISQLRSRFPLAVREAFPAIAEFGPDAGDAIDPLVALLISEAGQPDDILAYGAAQTLRAIGDAAVPKLNEALNSDSICVRVFAGMALGPKNGARAVPLLVVALKNKDQQLRVRTTQALGDIGPTAVDAVKPLLATLNEDSDPTVRYYAAKALGEIGPKAKDAVPDLIRVLTGRVDNPRGAAYALGRIGEPAIPELMSLLETEGLHHDVRFHASDALGSTGKAAIPSLLKLLRMKNFENHLAAITGLRLVGKGAVPSLLQNLSDPDATFRRRVVLVIGEIGGPAESALPELEKLARDENREVAAEANNSIQKIKKAVSERPQR